MPDADKIVDSDTNDSGVDHDGALKKLEEFREKIKRGLPIPLESSLSFASSVVDAIQHNDGIDDRKMLLEHMLTFVSRLPASTAQEKIANKLVKLLYNDLPHPPATYIGNHYAYRQADGSCNNLSDPNMGKAGMPYARSVQQAHPLPRNQLPDAGLIFDTLLKRDKFVKHPAGLSSLMFSFAALVIHTVFRTSHEDVNVNETSSYIDLAPLYGHNQEAQDKVRRRDGRGLLKNDAFAEDRLLLLPPATCVILVLFNRNHNYIARKLLEINERGTFQDPDMIPGGPQRMTLLLQQEEEIFQTARLINCTWFASAVFSDYFSAILGLVRQGSSWSLNPFGEIRNADHSLFERGRGNVCSVEFNCLYRWHATTSQEDEEWIHQVFGNLFPGADPDKLTINDMKAKAKDLQAQEPDVSHWTFGNLKRNEDGFFNDAELAAVLNNSTDHAAGAFRARGTPQIMRLHEIMGIEQNRRWGVCSLNDFRKFLGLKPYSTFLEWNSDPEVASAAEKLYGDIDMLELYVGLQAEEAKPVVDGAGLCPAYTISRAILSDAIALCRGDRFYTADYTPFNMTAWGFQDCQRDPTAPGYGSTLGRLFLRTLPNHFSHNSTYTWFPLMTPQAMKPILKNLGDFQLYDFKRPKENMGVATVSEYKEVMEVLKATERFGMPSHTKAATVITGHGFFIAPQDMFRGEREQRAILKALTGSPDATQKIKEYFYNKTRELMLHECWTGVGTNVRNVNIVRDVLKVVPIYWACEVAGIPLTDKEDPEDGVYSAKEMYEVLTDIYSYLFLDVAQTNMLNLQEKVKGQIEELLGYIKAAHGTGIRLSVSGFLNALSQIFRGKSDHDELAARFATLGYDSDTLANSILAILVGATVEMSQALVHIVNLYLDDNKPADLQALCQNPRLGAKDEALLQGLILEALRLDPAFTGVFREALKDEVVGKQTIPAGTKIFVNIKNADLDKTIFPSPKDIDPSRGSIDKYPFGDGSQRCLGQDLSTKIMASVLRGVFSFRKVRRAPGDSGKLKRFKSDTMKTSAYEYLSKQQKQTPWATSMIIQFE
ncbi:linoleate diol synthase [Panus rudis PR-1116 ss-1]|nr:linoleate diol synthase [Panus rudis PR-1116 ss-1]